MNLNIVQEALMEIKKGSTDVSTVLHDTQTKLSSIISTTSSVEKSQQFLCTSYEDFRKELDKFKAELLELKQENAALKEEVRVLKSSYQSVSTSVNEVNRDKISRNAVVLGLPVSRGENLKELICKVGTEIGFHNTERVLLEARRLPAASSSNPPPVLATFCTEKMKDDFLDQKRAHGILTTAAVCENHSGSTKRVTIRDDLTPKELELLRKVQARKGELNIKYVWPGRRGKILIRRHDGAKVEQVSCLEQLGPRHE